MLYPQKPEYKKIKFILSHLHMYVAELSPEIQKSVKVIFL